MDPKRLIIVDDNATFIEVVSRYFDNGTGLEIVGKAMDASSAVELAKALNPDVIVLDLGMPGLTGIEILPLIRVASPTSKIIILTLLDTEAYREAALKSGADAFISKAALSKELLPCIFRLFENGHQADAI